MDGYQLVTVLLSQIFTVFLGIGFFLGGGVAFSTVPTPATISLGALGIFHNPFLIVPEDTHRDGRPVQCRSVKSFLRMCSFDSFIFFMFVEKMLPRFWAYLVSNKTNGCFPSPSLGITHIEFIKKKYFQGLHSPKTDKKSHLNFISEVTGTLQFASRILKSINLSNKNRSAFL